MSSYLFLIKMKMHETRNKIIFFALSNIKDVQFKYI